MARQGPLDITARQSGTDGYDDLVERAVEEQVPGTTRPVMIASAEDIIASETAAGRPKELAMLPALRREPLDASDTRAER